MLLIHASAGPSAIHGTGLFAREPIAAGTLIWELRTGFDREFTIDQLEALPTADREAIRRYLYVDVTSGLSVLCADDARYMNHADLPNTRTAGRQTFAVSDISAGEELTCDYREFDAATREWRKQQRKPADS